MKQPVRGGYPLDGEEGGDRLRLEKRVRFSCGLLSQVFVIHASNTWHILAFCSPNGIGQRVFLHYSLSVAHSQQSLTSLKN